MVSGEPLARQVRNMPDSLVVPSQGETEELKGVQVFRRFLQSWNGRREEQDILFLSKLSEVVERIPVQTQVRNRSVFFHVGMVELVCQPRDV